MPSGREWHRIGQPGTVRKDRCNTIGEAKATLEQRAIAKVRRGYAGWTGNAAAAKEKAREGNDMENGKGAYPKG